MVQLQSERIKEIQDGPSQLVLHIEISTLSQAVPINLELADSEVDVREEVGGCGLEEQDLVVVVLVVGEIAALLADQLLVHDAVRHKVLQMV